MRKGTMKMSAFMGGGSDWNFDSGPSGERSRCGLVPDGTKRAFVAERLNTSSAGAAPKFPESSAGLPVGFEPESRRRAISVSSTGPMRVGSSTWGPRGGKGRRLLGGAFDARLLLGGAFTARLLAGAGTGMLAGAEGPGCEEPGCEGPGCGILPCDATGAGNEDWSARYRRRVVPSSIVPGGLSGVHVRGTGAPLARTCARASALWTKRVLPSK